MDTDYTLQQLLKSACEDSGEVNFRNTYSGRGMYGRQCVGITGSRDDCMRVIASVICELHNMDNSAFEEEVEELLGSDQDSMGYDIILYWPQLESIDEENIDIDADLSEE